MTPPDSSGPGVTLLGDAGPAQEEVLTEPALAFVVGLERQLRDSRQAILATRELLQAGFDDGLLPDFLSDTSSLREDAGWRVRSAPADLIDRRVEITGPVDRKMVINALNSGAQTYMADFEDSNSPTWPNCIEGQANLMAAVRRTISFDTSQKEYRLESKVATLMMRPRGWHLEDKHLIVDGRPISASLLDFGLFIFHNARLLIQSGSGPYLYLPKLESYLEARLWEQACSLAEGELALPAGSIRATVLIENVLAAFQMDEILFELRDRCVGLNAGRWDYLFSIIRKFRARTDFVLPDRAAVTMTVPFMQSYTDLLVKTCHRRGAHAMGGMAAFVPNRHDLRGTEMALAKVTQDKVREVGQGFDGTWVAHPDLVPTAAAVFDERMQGSPNQLERGRPEVRVGREELLSVPATPGQVSEQGILLNVSVGLRYLDSWLAGRGAVAIDNLMEDAATAEISRSQIWQWRSHSLMTPAQLEAALSRVAAENGPMEAASSLFEEVALGRDFVEFLTIPGCRRLP